MTIYEDLYPGNAAVFERFLSAMDDEGIAAFTGAGTSMPDMPGWGQLVRGLVTDAAKEGRLDQAAAAALEAEEGDFLYVIDEVYNAVGKAQIKAKVAKIFSSLAAPTEAHKLITSIRFDRMMTLNYDRGLEMAHATVLSRHVPSITTLQSNEVDEWLRHGKDGEVVPILHWHGQASDAGGIILAGSDYISFYEEAPKNKEILRDIFKTRRVLMIGFGFNDPFIERELNSVMQPLPKANSHFAIIGIPTTATLNMPLERRKYTTKYKLEAIFYPVRKSELGSDHSALLDVLKSITEKCPLVAADTAEQKVSGGSIAHITSLPVSHRQSLFTVGEKQIYCEPNLWTTRDVAAGFPESKISLSDIMADSSHCSITAPHEYGLSNLGRRLAWEISLSGKKALFRDAGSLPKYRRAIVSDADFASIETSEPLTVVLDNFSVVEHQRTVRELISTFTNLRLVVLQRSNFAAGADDGLSDLNFRTFKLHGLSRSDIRDVVNVIASDYNSDAASIVVDKVYSDLLQLCIPLTPSNVIMYSSVLCKDGSFSPVSRLHIVDRFVAEALQRASDAYADAFNAINKIDLISQFCFGLFSQSKSAFFDTEWASFCQIFKNENLVDFSASEILGDLLHGRIIIQEGRVYHFRYRMFFSYFVGRHIAARPDLLRSCISENRHLELDGLVEVLCGTLPDCSALLEDITAKLTQSIDKFYENYPISGLDFHEGETWDLSDNEEELWSAISERIETGPATTQELDQLKTSIQAERRTEDQKISIIKFIASEKNVNFHSWYLVTALESAKHASATAKKAAATAILRANTLAYEVAGVFIPLIAEKKYVSWNGFTYINLIEDKSIEDEGEKDKYRMHHLVASALPISIASATADRFGSRKLGPVFSALMNEEALNTPFKKYLLFCLLLRSKPSNWLLSAKKRVGEMSRTDLYLKHLIYSSIRQFRDEINTEAERQQLKDLIATLSLRRDVNLKFPSPRRVREAIGKLDAQDYWSEKPDES